MTRPPIKKLVDNSSLPMEQRAMLRTINELVEQTNENTRRIEESCPVKSPYPRIPAS